MTLQEIIHAVDSLSYHERYQLRQYLDEKLHELPLLSPEERIRNLEEAAAAIREGLSPEELQMMVDAMNQEFIEMVDDELWRD